MTPTRPRLLLLIMLIAGVLGWVLATVADSVFSRYLPVPWSAALAMWLLGFCLLTWTLLVRPRLLRRPGTQPVPPLVAARTAALALAASRVGAGVAGFYVGVLLVFLPDLSVPAAQTGAWVAVVTALGGAGIVAVALWLEALCRIRDGDDEDAADPDPAIDLRGIAGGAERAAHRAAPPRPTRRTSGR